MEPFEIICSKCRHYTPMLGGCKAFPDGIPAIIDKQNKHDKPIKGQKNNIVFEPNTP